GNNVHNLGFAHPALKEALIEQLQSLTFSTRRYTNQKAIQLAEKLTSYSPSLKRILFAPGGAEVVGLALKVARVVTGRYKVISMWDSFHGATLGASSVSGVASFTKGVGPLLTGVEHAPPPNPPECPFNCGSRCSMQCASYIEYMIEKQGDVGAVLAETIRSAPVIPPLEYWKEVRKICDRHGVLLILDEIPHALGRTGKIFTFQNYGIEPDMVLLGKGLGGGMLPIAALLAKEQFNKQVKSFSLGHYTHEKNPLSSAVALRLLQVIEEENLLDHVGEMHRFSMDELKKIKEDHRWVSDIRGLGLILGIELRNPVSGDKAFDLSERVMYRCNELGLNFKLSMGNIINLAPPITVRKEELSQAFEMIDQSLKELS
ncbi:MAG: aspartate aminotransferase family protein, partial [Bacteroidetes bacterium]|nr:aspartate aminotransferase family protein [Bacteroidota bacterium]